MDGYATLDTHQFTKLLELAIPNVERRIKELYAEDIEERKEIFDAIWAKRSMLFGPWNEKGCWHRVNGRLGMFGSTSAQMQVHGVENLLKQYQAQLVSLNGKMNGEPYLLDLKSFNRLQGWAE